MTTTPVILDSVTHLDESHRGRAAHCASHGGMYAGYYAAKMGVGAVILNDAGIGRERAGVAGLDLLQDLGVAAAAISHRSARIGDGADGVERGVLSTVNMTAAALGLHAGMACGQALDILANHPLEPSPPPKAIDEARFEELSAASEGIKVIIMDSISLVAPEDDGHIVVAASHGAILGGRAETAIKHPVFAVVSNDADRGIDDAGVSRLPVLDERGIAGACASAFSSRIGDGRSLYNDGYISILNEAARLHGGHVGQSVKEFVAAMVAARKQELDKT